MKKTILVFTLLITVSSVFFLGNLTKAKEEGQDRSNEYYDLSNSGISEADDVTPIVVYL